MASLENAKISMRNRFDPFGVGIDRFFRCASEAKELGDLVISQACKDILDKVSFIASYRIKECELKGFSEKVKLYAVS